MSLRLDLDGSLIQVAPTLDDIEAVLVVKTRYRGLDAEGADGIIRKVTVKDGRRTRTEIPRVELEGLACYETRIGSNDKGQPEYEVRTVYLAGGTGNVFLAADRRVRFSLRWYGDKSRYLELRVRIFGPSGCEVVANRGMAPFGSNDRFNFLGSLQSGDWVEVHYDNHAHVGLSMTVHPSSHDFSEWKAPPAKVEVRRDTPTRFQRVNDDDE